MLTLVFCPEKELQMRKPQNETEELKKEVEDASTSDLQSHSGFTGRAYIEIIAKDTLIEEEAMIQLGSTSKLKGCTHAFGMPDLHPGKGIPIGASIITQDIVYPELVDYDIGCGMSFIKTGIQSNKMTSKRLEQLSTSLISIDCPWG